MAYSRNRVIYQSEALFVSPTATGFHYTGDLGIGLTSPPLSATDTVGWDCGNVWPPFNAGGTDPSYAANQGTVVSQLKRIQSINYGFTVARTDVNQYGELARLDSVPLSEAPVNLDFSYYLLDGYNERLIGLVIDGNNFPMSQDMSGSDGRNYFIETVPEARDVVSGDINIPNKDKTVIAIGNGFVTDYSVDLSVGGVPSVTVSVEAYNMQADIGTTGIDNPALDPRNGALMSDAWVEGSPGTCKADGCINLFSLPPASKSYDGCDAGGVAALRPGDIVLDLGNAALISKQVSGQADETRVGSAHVQSASISFPLGRTDIQRLGSTTPFTKALDFPLTVTLTISALVSELKAGRLTEALCRCATDLMITVYDPSCSDCERTTTDIAVQYKFTNAELDSESFSSTIGDNKTVDLTFSVQGG